MRPGKAYGLCWLASLLWGACLAVSCQQKDSAAATDNKTPARAETATLVPVDLALRVNPTLVTKADVTQREELAPNPTFRGMVDVRVLPFARSGKVVSGDITLDGVFALPDIGDTQDPAAVLADGSDHEGLVENLQAHLYSDRYASAPAGTASFLVYGQARPLAQESGEDLITWKHRNGSLLVGDGLDLHSGTRSTAGITFTPEPIDASGVTSRAAAIASILNAIAVGATYQTTYYYQVGGNWQNRSISVSWDQSVDESRLRDYFDRFTNDGQLMSASGPHVEYILTSLHGLLKNYTSEDDRPVKLWQGGEEYTAYTELGGSTVLTYGMLWEALCNVLLDRMDCAQLAIDATTGDVQFTGEWTPLRQFPENLGLPGGSVGLRWTPTGFIPITEEGLDNIAPADNYCYSPSLWYFVNTGLATSEREDIRRWYRSSFTAPWSTFVLNYYQDGPVVTRATRSVAVEEPLQYGNALLVMNLEVAGNYLGDNTEEGYSIIPVYGSRFPVTGLILTGQYQQDFSFTPVPGAHEYYSFDSSFSGVYMGSDPPSQVRSLALQNPEGESVYFCLEFRNDSGLSFMGVDGRVLPGSKFYMVGKLELPENPTLPSVFVQDCMTTVNCTVNSLANAHNTVPDLSKPQLTLGVQTQVNWILSTGSTIILY